MPNRVSISFHYGNAATEALHDGTLAMVTRVRSMLCTNVERWSDILWQELVTTTLALNQTDQESLRSASRRSCNCVQQK